MGLQHEASPEFFENWAACRNGSAANRSRSSPPTIVRHWAGLAAYCGPENKAARGFVEGLNNKIRVIQRRAYGLRDEEYLRLKVVTCMLPPCSGLPKRSRVLARACQGNARNGGARD